MSPNLVDLGHLCDYCNITKGFSVIFTSFDEYVNHVTKNHPAETSYHNGTTDLDVFKAKQIEERERRLRQRQNQHLEQSSLIWQQRQEQEKQPVENMSYRMRISWLHRNANTGEQRKRLVQQIMTAKEEKRRLEEEEWKESILGLAH